MYGQCVVQTPLIARERLACQLVGDERLFQRPERGANGFGQLFRQDERCLLAARFADRKGESPLASQLNACAFRLHRLGDRAGDEG